MNERTRRLLIGSGITAAMVALAGSARHGAADYLTRLALDRQLPPHHYRAKKRLVTECTQPHMSLQVRQAGLRLSTLPHETVRLTDGDGTVLVGHWFAVKNPRRVVIAMHGWRSSWERDFGLIAPFFRDNACSVLYAEQRGQGRSGGEYMGFGLTERYDCAAWAQWSNQRTGDAVPIYLCGVSMGASTVLMAAGLPLPGNVRGILADCGYTSPVEIWKYVAGAMRLSYGFWGGAVGKLAKKRLRTAMDAASCPAALADSHLPVLFIHGSDDRFVPVEMTYTNFKACRGPRRLLIVPGAGHGMSYLTDRDSYEQAVLGFWAEFDEKR